MLALGRIAPTDWSHVEKYPLKALGTAAPTFVPVSIGVNWYTSFDTPKQDRLNKSWHLPNCEFEDLGTVRGGHCVCVAPMGAVAQLQRAWWIFYNQGQEGACEGFGHAHAATLLRGVTFDAFWLYDQARKLEGTYPNGEGSSNRAVVEVLLKQGLRAQNTTVAERVATADTDNAADGSDGAVSPTLGISKVRWATTAEEICHALGRDGAESVPVLNSWGEEYPPVVWLPKPTLARLMGEGGEADVVTER